MPMLIRYKSDTLFTFVLRSTPILARPLLLSVFVFWTQSTPHPANRTSRGPNHLFASSRRARNLNVHTAGVLPGGKRLRHTNSDLTACRAIPAKKPRRLHPRPLPIASPQERGASYCEPTRPPRARWTSFIPNRPPAADLFGNEYEERTTPRTLSDSFARRESKSISSEPPDSALAMRVLPASWNAMPKNQKTGYDNASCYRTG